MRFLLGLLALGIYWTAHASMPTWRGVEIRQMVQSAAQPDWVYAMGNGLVFRSDDHGKTWSPLRMPQPAEYTELHLDPKDARHVLVLARNTDAKETPKLQESFDGGLHWTQRAPLKFSEANGSIGGDFFPTQLVIPAGRQAGDWWAYDGRWFRSPDGGQTWLRQPGGRPVLGVVRGNSFSYSLDDNVLQRSGDGGKSWEKVHEFESQIKPGQRARTLSNLIALSDSELVVRNAEGNWLQSSDHGSSWAPASNGFQSLDQQQPASAGPESAAQWRGETWCSAQQSPAVADMLLARCIWDNGSWPSSTCFHVSTDAGRSWTPPRTPGSRSDSDCYAPGLRIGWAPTAVLLDATDPQRMLAAWQAGGLYRSDDGGKTWQTSDTGLMFRSPRETAIDWAAVGEPPLIQAVLHRNRELLMRTLASGVDINSPGNHLGGVLDADLAARETQTRLGEPIHPMMWPELRKAGATSFAVVRPRTRLLTRALDLKLNDIPDELIRSGYDWGASATERTDLPQGELFELLRLSEHFGLTPAQVKRWIDMYISAARFPSADQTTLDLLNTGHPELAVRVLKATSRRTPFDRQSTAPRTPRRLIAEGLEAAGKKSWAKRILATMQ
ncbi:sialidase family protein [Variovorax sp. OV084]|jgi:photosystem II stability/assembly factor-like uncharacterized protein|uniref:sialidase family protein n=1 Tax=Variovorax sp. OV084 TaxID=1882777 RepID=UPI0008CDB61E|nr:sialidase family protein [Variovorax sp. OV084]SET92629.1 BNR/Asp-box repeat-containing protein [Variovorax sp. OV084]